ncbi:MAG: aminotransferase class III-fold pyridoxal phosphate-dependent enzyme [Pseudonocardiaceae bacterium]|nr:aminotransferase class III-fold pyridoxal phosphate-dependent enzyme [Pseudonocardiaceae bacterium]
MSSSEALYGRATNVIPGGNTRSTVFVAPHPPYAAQGAGATITDSDGHQVIDANNNYTSLIHGHAEPSVLASAVDAAGKGTAFGLPTRYEVDLAEVLYERTGLAQWRFCNSGTEAVMMLIRAARAYTGRDLVVRFDGSYHGTSDTVVDARRGVPDGVRDSVLVLPQGDQAAVTETMARYGDRVATILIDLMPNRAGLTPADPAYVSLLRELTHRHGALLAIDEVITFRLGTGGLSGLYGVDPDLMSLGKVIGGGFPVGAVGGPRQVLSTFSPLDSGSVSWGGTFSANPVSMAAGLTTLELFDAKAVAELNGTGDRLRGQLSQAGVRASGRGSLVRLFPDDVRTTWWELYRRGVLVGSNGLIALSTVMSDEHIAAIGKTVTEILATK